MRTLRTLYRDNKTIVAYAILFAAAIAASMIGTGIIAWISESVTW